MLKNILKQAVVLSLALGSAAAIASTYTFTGVNANEVDISSQLSLEVTQTGSSVDFKFINAAGGTDVFVGAIFFDFLGANLFSSLTQTGQLGTVSFTGITPSTQNLPEANSFTTNAVGDRDGGAVNGINTGEYLIFTALLSEGANIDELLSNGGLNVGLHLQGYASEGSDTYINAVPLPAAGWLFGSALVGLMGLSRRKL